jgi:hypothetical protein
VTVGSRTQQSLQLRDKTGVRKQILRIQSGNRRGKTRSDRSRSRAEVKKAYPVRGESDGIELLSARTSIAEASAAGRSGLSRQAATRPSRTSSNYVRAPRGVERTLNCVAIVVMGELLTVRARASSARISRSA